MIFTRHTIPNALRALARLFRRSFGKDPVLADPDVTAERRARCNVCSWRVGDQCHICTCVIPLKTMMAGETCPDGRWREQTRNSTGL